MRAHGAPHHHHHPRGGLEVLQALHLVLYAVHVLYPYLTWRVPHRELWDHVYLCGVFAIYLHWLPFRNECLLSYWEKRIIDDTYALGECPSIMPFQYWLQADAIVAAHAGWIALVSTILTMWRMRSPGPARKLGIAALVVPVYVYTTLLPVPAPTPQCGALEARGRRVVQERKSARAAPAPACAPSS